MGLFSWLFGKSKNEGNIRQREGQPDVYNIESEDDRMTWMIEKAGLTLHYFEECLKSPKNGQDHFSVKVRFEDGDKVEHMWISDPEFDAEGNLFGEVGNDPIDVKTVKLGQKVGIDRNFISDWMIIEGGRLIGGYTIRAVRDGLQESQWPEFDKSIGGLYIDEGEDYFEVNQSTPEGAILTIETAYGEGNIEKAMSCKSFTREAAELLQRTGNADKPELIAKTAEVLQLSFIKSLQESGMPSFEGVRRAFPRREKITDDHYVITEVCFYPDRTKSNQKLNTYLEDGSWKVGAPVD